MSSSSNSHKSKRKAIVRISRKPSKETKRLRAENEDLLERLMNAYDLLEQHKHEYVKCDQCDHAFNTDESDYDRCSNDVGGMGEGCQVYVCTMPWCDGTKPNPLQECFACKELMCPCCRQSCRHCHATFCQGYGPCDIKHDEVCPYDECRICRTSVRKGSGCQCEQCGYTLCNACFLGHKDGHNALRCHQCKRTFGAQEEEIRCRVCAMLCCEACFTKHDYSKCTNKN